MCLIGGRQGMRIEVSCDPCVVDEEVDVSVARFDFLNNGQQTCAVCDITLHRNDVTVSL